MTPQVIETKFGRAELSHEAGHLTTDTGHESISLTTKIVDGELHLTMSSGERELFEGTASEVETAFEVLSAISGLRGNESFITCLSRQKGHPDIDALLAYITSLS